MKEAESNEQFFYGPVQSNKGTTDDDDEDENFSDANETPKQVTSSQIKQTPVVAPPAKNKVEQKKKEKDVFMFIEIFSRLLNHQQLVN
jgi:hypothetical protein